MERGSCRFGIRRAFPAGPLVNRLGQVCGNDLSSEEIVPVRTARVVVANYGAILHDFSHSFNREFAERFKDVSCERCRILNKICPDAIDQWLVEKAAFVSAAHVDHQVVNSPISHGDRVARGYRPPQYGRALVLPVDTDDCPGGAGFLDVKGAGVGPGIAPSHEDHSDGLEYLGYALADYFYGWIIDKIFENTVPSYSSVPVYAVLDLGFDIVGGWMGTAPAGLHVRRAHSRVSGGMRPPMSGSGEEMVQIQIELLLRSFGLTTASNYLDIVTDGNIRKISLAGTVLESVSEKEQAKIDQLQSNLKGRPLEMINLQLTTGADWNTRTAQLVDFGHVYTRKRYTKSFCSRAQDGIFKIGRVINPDSPGFPQPDPEFALNDDLFNRDSVNAVGFYFAELFRSGKADSRAIERMLRKGIRTAGF